MKKLLSILLATVLLLTCIPLGAVSVSAATVNDLTYKIADGAVTITDCDTAAFGEMVIPATIESYPVTQIGGGAFYNCDNLTSVTIPDSVTSIGEYAFRDCDRLTSVVIPDGVTTIGIYAFALCSSLTSINVPNSVSSIDYGTFIGCTSLTSITIPDNVIFIVFDAFSSCTSLTSVTILNPDIYIDYGSFNDCPSLTDVYFSGTREDIYIDESYGSLYTATWHYHEHSYDDDYDTDCNECGKTRCIHEYFSACDIVCLICNEVSREASHNVVHVPAVANTCYTEGNIEYWYCTECGYAWLDEDCTLNTNLKAVILPITHSESDLCHNYRCTLCGDLIKYNHVRHVEAVTPTHFTEGNVEYWYCEMCGTYFLDEDCTEIVEYETTIILPISHNIVHVEAKAPTCTELGNIEYWYCTECGYAWLNEDCTLNTNLKAVILPMAEHTYDHSHDIDCNECGNIRTMNAPATFGGNSVSEDVSGLAFRFDVSVVGMKMNRTTAIYDGATIDDYKLIKMGAIVTNRVDTIDIPCVYLWELKSDSCNFAVRLINIPTDKYDVAITATPYVVLEIDGVATTIYGEAQTSTYNNASIG